MASTFGTSGGGWGAGPRPADMRSRRLREVAVQFDGKYDKAGGPIQGDVQVQGRLTVQGDVVSQERVLAKQAFASSDDPTTGIAFDVAGAGTLSVLRGGESRILVSTNLGFGTVLPSAPFEFQHANSTPYNPAADNRGGRAMSVLNNPAGTSAAHSSILLQAGDAQALVSAVVDTTGNARGTLAFSTHSDDVGNVPEKMRIAWDGRVGIGSSDPHPSAQLDVASSTRGFLLPRMTGVQANAIVNKAEGLMVYVTAAGGTPFNFTSSGWWGWDGVTWRQLA
jgi:hypothetical protein